MQLLPPRRGLRRTLNLAAATLFAVGGLAAAQDEWAPVAQSVSGDVVVSAKPGSGRLLNGWLYVVAARARTAEGTAEVLMGVRVLDCAAGVGTLHVHDTDGDPLFKRPFTLGGPSVVDITAAQFCREALAASQPSTGGV